MCNFAGRKSGKRVSLDPHAVLLHAALEGELELVKNVIHQVECHMNIKFYCHQHCEVVVGNALLFGMWWYK